MEETQLSQTPTPINPPVKNNFSTRYNTPALVASIVAILGVGAAVTFGVLWATKPTAETTTSNNQTTNTSNQTATEITRCETTTGEIKETACDCSGSELAVFNGNVVNGTAGMDYAIGGGLDSIGSMYDGQDGYMINLAISSNQKAHLSLDWARINQAYNTNHSIADATSRYEQFDIETNGRFVDGIIATYGQATGGEIIYLLTENGDVEYIPVQQAVSTGNIKSYGKAEGLSNIVRFYRGSSIPSGSPVGMGADTFALDKDGNAYSLYNLSKE